MKKKVCFFPLLSHHKHQHIRLLWPLATNKCVRFLLTNNQPVNSVADTRSDVIYLEIAAVPTGWGLSPIWLLLTCNANGKPQVVLCFWPTDYKLGFPRISVWVLLICYSDSQNSEKKWLPVYLKGYHKGCRWRDAKDKVQRKGCRASMPLAMYSMPSPGVPPWRNLPVFLYLKAPQTLFVLDYFYRSFIALAWLIKPLATDDQLSLQSLTPPLTMGMAESPNRLILLGLSDDQPHPEAT